MFRVLITFLLLASFARAQTKKPATAGGANKKTVNASRQQAVRDSIAKDSLATIIKETFVIPEEFTVYTRRSKNKKERTKLCINLVSKDSILNYCVNDSICKDPEFSKILFEKTQGDTNYVLVYIRAFSKPEDKPACDAGKEVKVYFFRWNTKTNKAVVKLKNIESCMKGVTNMTRESIDTWDGSSPLIFKYHKGGQNFVETKFDPQNYLLGLQSVGD